MTSAQALRTINAALSVADAKPGGDYQIKLAVRCYNIPDLADQITASAVLDRASADALSNDTASFGKMLDLATPSRDRKAAGERLFGTAFQGKVAELWSQLRPRVAADQPLRVRLDIQPARLRALPWELLFGLQEWIFLQKNTYTWRGPEPQSPPEGEEKGPLRVLVVVCNPLDWRLLGNQELAGITGSLAGQLSKIHLEILDGPDFERLSREIDRLKPHVLHFIGHGMPRVAGQDAEIAFNWEPREQGASGTSQAQWEMSREAVGQLADWAPPLVIINACRTAEDPYAPVGGLSEAFLAAGARAAVSMQADIQSAAAVRFSAALYRGLARLAPLDQAVAQARLQLVRHSRNTGEWALPVLAAHTDPADVLRICFAPTTSSISGVCERREYGQLRGFLDRSSERRNAWWALDPQPEHPSAQTLLVIGGRPVNRDDRPGKTWLTRWCLMTHFLRGCRVTYVNLADPLRYTDPDTSQQRQVKTKDWLDVVRVVREACLSGEQLEPLPAEAFGEFNSSLNVLVGGEAKTDRAGSKPGPVPDDWRSFNNDRRHALERAQRVCSEFLAALRAAADGRPHVIALDNVDRILPEAFDMSVYPWLIRPVAEDPRSMIRLVLVGSDEWLEPRLPAADRGPWTWLHLEGFESSQFMRLTWDYCQRQGLELDGNILQYFEALANLYMTSAALPVKFFDKAAGLIPVRQQAGQP